MSLESKEARRLQALHQYNILDTPPEEQFDRIVRLATRWFDVPIALIALLNSNRQWFKAAKGLDQQETTREIAFCAHNIYSDELFVVEDALRDPRFRDNPLVTDRPGIRFYAGAPLITPSGYNLGSLCLIDTVPRDAEAMDLGSLHDLAAIVVDEFELRTTGEEIEERNRQVQSLVQELTNAEEQERDRLSHLLQEELQQVLQAARMKLQNLSESASLSEEETTQFGRVTDLIDEAIDTTQSLSSRFAPPIGNQSLPDTFKWLSSRLKETHDLSVSVHADEGFLTTDETSQKLLYRVVRELLFNVVKHAGTNTARLFLTEEEHRIRVVVEGEGLKFDLDRQSESTFELASARERIEMVGGTFEVSARPDEGTRVMIEVPSN